MQHPLDSLLADPWSTLRLVVGEPLHPGGTDATATLLDRAGVGDSTRVLDAGCGAGEAVELARRRGARAVGLDLAPAEVPMVRGELSHLPFRTRSFDVVLTECVLCLADDVEAALAETRRVLDDGGRLALSDVVVEGELSLPQPLVEGLCLGGSRDRETLLDRLDRAGFVVADVREHREDLLAMRDRAERRVDYRGLLQRFGDRGTRLLEGIDDLETAIQTGRVGYVSLVATAE